MGTLGSLVLRDAARELGLPWDTSVSPYGSDDGTVVQLVALLNASGQDFARDYNWSALQTIAYIGLESGNPGSYELPLDLNRVQPFTLYAADAKTPYGQPLTPQQWARLQYQPAVAMLYPPYRIVNGGIEFYQPPPEDDTARLTYQSNYWCTAAGSLTPYAAELSDARPEALFDHRMLVTDLKARWLEAKGEDSTAARMDQQKAMSRAMGADGPAQALDIGGPSRGVRLIDAFNLPTTGWGGR